MKQPVFHPDARAELSWSVEFYDGLLSGLGARFLNAVETASARLVKHAEAGSPIGGDLRKRIVPGFPYSLIYHVRGDHIFIVAVAHHRQRPGYWLTDRR